MSGDEKEIKHCLLDVTNTSKGGNKTMGKIVLSMFNIFNFHFFPNFCFKFQHFVI